ncbi:MAG TPA: four helix bundle protein [Patescibacteria group bacterium]|nr:four helix bundle protein [Patescibacteria group bacterium]
MRQRIYKWILELVQFTDSLSNYDQMAKIGKDQLLRSGTSIGANYIEAIAGSTRKDFTNFLSHALKSANESKFWLSLLKDTKKGNLTKIDTLLKELIQIANILASSIKTLRTNK